MQQFNADGGGGRRATHASPYKLTFRNALPVYSILLDLILQGAIADVQRLRRPLLIPVIFDQCLEDGVSLDLDRFSLADLFQRERFEGRGRFFRLGPASAGRTISLRTYFSSLKTTSRRIIFSNSRIFPGQE